MLPSPGINILVGDNASGKTSILEAIFFLGRGHSFRGSNARQVIQEGQKAFTVQGKIYRTDAPSRRLAIHRTRSSIEYKRDGQAQTTRLELVNTLPLQLIDPSVHRLLEDGPRHRRRFLDWGVFHMEHMFFPAWQRYRRALRQRNRALKAHWPKKDLVTWDAELVQNGEIVDACRRSYVEDVRQHMPERARQLLGAKPLALNYFCGWRGADGLGAALAANLDRDRKAGFTQQGPHRADFRVSIADTAARGWVSHGQQKVLTSVMLIVQAALLCNKRGAAPVLLIDDLAAELGPQYRDVLAEQIVALGGQCFMTFLDTSVVPGVLKNKAVFHVEQGRLALA